MKVVHCPCGVDVNGESDDELVTNVEQHIKDDTRIWRASTRGTRS